jgi:diguanylate cyclase (GGDEF)-like protein
MLGIDLDKGWQTGVEMQEPLARILLIGSELVDYRRLGEMLSGMKAHSYHLLWCEKYDDNSLPEINSGNYDAILLDCQHQPDMAIHLLDQLVEEGCRQPIITLAANSDSAVAQQAMQNGSSDYLGMDNIDSYVLERCLGYAIEKYAVEKKISQLNLYDPLTGIANRMLFQQSMGRAIELAKAQQISLALLLINLDGFKRINESFGTDAGDRLVTTMAQRLTRCVRKSDTVARIGGDEFTLVLEDSHSSEDTALVAQKVIDALAAPCTIGGQPVIVSCSIGVATYPESGDSVDGLLKRANMAMLEAKAQRGSQCCFYNEETSKEAMHRMNMEKDMRLALRRNEFELFYQPRVEISSGDAVGMEALIRWHHPVRGLVPPNEFIPVAEETGLIVPIGYWVIQQACKDMLRFDQCGHSDLEIAVNLSFKQLQDNMFVDTATRIIRQSGIDASRLEFELTETAIMSNYQQTYDGMMALSQLGVTFSLDDFGTGFSSFAHIQRLPISALKVDRSFVDNVVKNNDDAIIVKAMINLAHSLRLQVVAEGVETLEQVQFLWQNHCDQVQGFYFSEAVTVDNFVDMMDQRATATM